MTPPQQEVLDAAKAEPANMKFEIPQDEVDAIIRTKRKARDPKACYACHRRKVKCDRKLPCDSCIKRDHPELCSYERPTKRRRIAIPGHAPVADEDGAMQSPGSAGFSWASVAAQQTGPSVTIPREQWDRINRELELTQEALQTYRAGEDEPASEAASPAAENNSRSEESEREGIHAPSGQMGTMHLGSRSVLAYMMGLGRSKSSQDTARNLLEENVLPQLGLDNETATYPFVDLWSTDPCLQDVSGLLSALPEDGLCREFFVAYRDVACTIYPVVSDTVEFEMHLNMLLETRARDREQGTMVNADKPYGVSLSWLALLFAVLASGAQTTGRPAKERELTSQVYTCCSYQALRMANFLTHPSLDAIQALLIVGNVLSYNMNPGVSYILLGMTMRMAFSIGLQTDSQNFSFSCQYLRSRVWWALAWQDSHFAVSYDRPTASVLCCPEIPYRKISTPGLRSYPESMFRIIKLTQEIIRERVLNPRTTMPWSTIQSYKEEVARIVTDGAPHLRERSRCLKLTQHLERLALKLHSCYITSELCRPALKESLHHPSPHAHAPISSTSLIYQQNRRRSSGGSHQSHFPPTSDPMPQTLRAECILNLKGTVDAYVELHSLSPSAARSWIGIQRSISAAFLLGILPETQQDPRIHSLLRQLEMVISQRAHEDLGFTNGTHDPTNLSPPAPGVPLVVDPPLTESPHWAKSMMRSLKALSKMNAALAASETPESGPEGGSRITNGNVSSNGKILLSSSGYNAMIMPAPSGSLSQSGHSQSQSPTAPRWPGRYDAFQAVRTQQQQQQQQQQQILKRESISPNVVMAGLAPGVAGIPGVGGPITPDSTSSGEWNYSTINEKAMEFVQPALWG